MNINFSRHAKRRMQLYKILEEDVINAIGDYITNSRFSSGKKEIVSKGLSKKYGYPLKIVFYRGNDTITVITAYPLRKGHLQ